MSGILACGAYLPRLRIARTVIAAANSWLRAPGGAAAKGERTFCNWDEDAITMAVEAARACLASRDRSTIRSLVLASTTLPFADRSNAGIVAAALDLPASTQCTDLCGSQRAGTQALLQALQRADGADGEVLVIASDRRLAKPGSPQELAYGHGAAAVLIGEGPVVAQLLGAASLHSDLVDHYRSSGAAYDYTLEERWVRDEGHLKVLPEVIGSALNDAQVTAEQIARILLPVPSRTAQVVTQRAGMAVSALEDDIVGVCGEIGVAHALLRLAKTLDEAQPGDRVLLAGFGQGADALVLRVFEREPGPEADRKFPQLLAERIEEQQYTRFLSHCGLLGVDFGMRAERDNRTAHSASFRRHRDLLAFVGGRCTACGTVQFPRSHVCVNPQCRAFETQVTHPLAETRGCVKTFTEDWLAYSARPPLVYGNVALEAGGNAFIEFADTMPGELAVGRPVRFSFRIKDVDTLRGFQRYFWKATPVQD